jgi:chemotaxis protein CheX
MGTDINLTAKGTEMRLILDQTKMAEAMLSSTSEVFTMMLNSAIKHEDPTHGASVNSEEYGVLSLIGLTGEWAGSAGLCCSADCARWIASQMMFTEYAEVDAEVRDAVGEITNMIVGNFKNNISDQTGPLAMSTPTVVVGREMQATIQGVAEWVVFPFSSTEYSFSLMVQLNSPSARRTYPGIKRPVPEGSTVVAS